jgi:hypothetical protein
MFFRSLRFTRAAGCPRFASLRWTLTWAESAPMRTLSRSPPPRIALRVEAGDHDNSVLLHLKENSVRKPSDPRSSPSAMNCRKLQRSLRDGFHRSIHSNCKTLPKGPGECRHTKPAPAAVPRRPRTSRRRAASRFLKQVRPDFFPLSGQSSGWADSFPKAVDNLARSTRVAKACR